VPAPHLGLSLDEVAGAASGTRAVGVASVTPESAAVTAAVAQLAKKFAAPSAAPAGVAAAVWGGMGWRRAQRRRPVLFAVGSHAIGGVVRGGVPITGAHRRAGSVGWLSLNPSSDTVRRKP